MFIEGGRGVSLDVTHPIGMVIQLAVFIEGGRGVSLGVTHPIGMGIQTLMWRVAYYPIGIGIKP